MHICWWTLHVYAHWRRCGLMVSALDSGSNGTVLVWALGHCVVLSKTACGQSASIHPGVLMGAVKAASHPGGSWNTAGHFMRQKPVTWQLAHTCMQTLLYLTFTCTCMFFYLSPGRVWWSFCWWIIHWTVPSVIRVESATFRISRWLLAVTEADL